MLDRFYTPTPMASALVEAVEAPAASCVDPACGSGALLQAAESRFTNIECLGLDIDRSAIARARRKSPHWILSVGDILEPASRRHTSVVAAGYGVDLVACNPPFSMGSKKGIRTEFLPENRCSVAMAHLLAALELFRPRVALAAIVPESLMFSELDEIGRDTLQRYGRLSIVAEGRNTAFSGARANTLLITLTRNEVNETETARSLDAPIPCELIRGGVSIHEAERLPYGTPLIHTSDFDAVTGMANCTLDRVRRIRRGVVDGHVVLLPRVGVPIERYCTPICLPRPVQLSDCVFALRFSSARRAHTAATILRRRYADLRALYRGTGARYVSRRRLMDWLRVSGFAIQNQT